MSKRTIQFIFSLIFLVGYFTILLSIFYVEVSDTINMSEGGNSMMGELTILIGILTAAVGQILNFWFNTNKKLEVAE